MTATTVKTQPLLTDISPDISAQNFGDEPPENMEFVNGKSVEKTGMTLEGV